MRTFSSAPFALSKYAVSFAERIAVQLFIYIFKYTILNYTQAKNVMKF